MIYVGIDDTDVLDSPGTNQLARALVARVAERFRCVLIVRHQLLDDPRVPYTSKNGSASIQLAPLASVDRESWQWLIDELRTGMRQWFIEGSDPGLCVTETVPAAVTDFGRRCKMELIAQDEARALAGALDIHLEGLGGTQGGVIGALAAVGLAATGDDGRVVTIGTWPDDLSDAQDFDTLEARGVVVRCVDSHEHIRSGTVDVGKHLRPNYRGGEIVLFVRRAEVAGNESHEVLWNAIRFP